MLNKIKNVLCIDTIPKNGSQFTIINHNPLNEIFRWRTVLVSYNTPSILIFRVHNLTTSASCLHSHKGLSNKPFEYH